MRHFKVTLILLSLVACTSAGAQRLPYLKWSTTEGLAQSQVRCLHKDPQGYMWIGTLGGVSKFNGREFQNYSKREGLASNQVNAITHLADSSIAFGSIGALTLFDGSSFTVHPMPEPCEKAQLNSFCTDCDQNALIIASENGLIRFDGRSSMVLGPDQLTDPHIKRVIPHGENWIIFTKTGVHRYLPSNEKLETLFTGQDIGGVNLMDACSDNEGGWLLATIGNGILRLKDGEVSELTDSSGGFTRNITGITQGQNGDFWAKSRDGFFLLRQSDGKWISTFYGENTGLDNTDIRALHPDPFGNVWLGTYGGGLRKFIANGVQQLSTAHGLSGDIVMSILPDGENTWWLSTYDNGITKIEDGQYAHFGTESGLKSTRIWCSAVDKTGRKWFGSSGGLSYFDNGQFITFNRQDGLPHQQVLSIYPEADSSILVGTARGLARISTVNGSFTAQSIEEVPEVKIRAIKKHPDGSLWMASNNGVYQLKNGIVKHLSEEDGLPDNSVFCLEISIDQSIWVGTESGLACIRNEGNIESLFLQGGFGANHVNFIAFQKDGSIWLGTNDGIFFSDNPEKKSPKWRHFGEHDGITLPETNQNAVYLDEQQLWFGTSGALNMLDLAELMPEPDLVSVHTVLKELRINLIEPNWEKYGLEKNKYRQWPENLLVPYTDNHFTFLFDAPNLRDPNNQSFQYYLEGIEETWEPPTETEQVGYSQLPFGEYTFHVRVIDNQGNTGVPTSFSFAISPPFWLRWWFIALEVLLVTVIVIIISRRRRMALIEKFEKQQLQFKSRMLALEQQSLNSSMNRHFIFNALNAIQYYINRQDRLSANRYLTSFAKLIRKNLDSSQANMSSLSDEIERLQLYLKLEQMRFEEKFDYAINFHPELDSHSLQIPAMLLQPFLENSIWHGILPKGEKGHIDVNIKPFDKESYVVEIYDNGIGIDTSRENKREDEDHISQGMKITAGRVELLQKMTRKKFQIIGPEELKNNNGSIDGTIVRLVLPIDLDLKSQH